MATEAQGDVTIYFLKIVMVAGMITYSGTSTSLWKIELQGVYFVVKKFEIHNIHFHLLKVFHMLKFTKLCTKI